MTDRIEQLLINSLQSVRSTQIEADVELNLEKNL